MGNSEKNPESRQTSVVFWKDPERQVRDYSSLGEA